MHELGIVYSIVKTVEEFALKNNVTVIDSIVLQVGEMSSVVPNYLQQCFPAAVDGTAMEKTKLVIEVIEATGTCKCCNTVFKVVVNKGYCPKCNKREFDFISGKEFIIKEIVAM